MIGISSNSWLIVIVRRRHIWIIPPSSLNRLPDSPRDITDHCIVRFIRLSFPHLADENPRQIVDLSVGEILQVELVFPLGDSGSGLLFRRQQWSPVPDVLGHFLVTLGVAQIPQTSYLEVTDVLHWAGPRQYGSLLLRKSHLVSSHFRGGESFVETTLICCWGLFTARTQLFLSTLRTSLWQRLSVNLTQISSI